jgi:hypothetical protein
LLSDFEALMADESLVDADVRMTNQRSPVGRYLDTFGGIMSGQRIGYIRVSTLDQHTKRQLHGIQVDKTFTDKASGFTGRRYTITGGEDR